MSRDKLRKSEKDYEVFLGSCGVELTQLQREYAVCYYKSKYTTPVIMRTPHINDEYNQIIELIRKHEKGLGEKVW